MNYLVVIKELSSGSIEKNITSFDSDDSALRKFHEAFNVIGGGPKKISAILMRDINTNLISASTVDIVKNETWVLEETPEESEE